jgi:hypothetical protein
MAKVFLMWILPLALMIYALVDCAQDDDVERTSVPKVMWIMLIVLLPMAGSIGWLVVSKIARRKAGLPDRAAPRSPSPGVAHRPVAPDDDPDFLRRLGEQTRRQRRENNQDSPPDA